MNDIRTLTLRFYSQMARRFQHFSLQRGYIPALSRDGDWYVFTTVFQTKQDRSKFVQAWAKESMVAHE
jgi:hypothetical protein